ncbi:MAG: hypothetical protein ACYDGN_01665 [Acidimicrobiales bacterium]
MPAEWADGLRQAIVAETAHKEPFDLLFAVPKFEHEGVVDLIGRLANPPDDFVHAREQGVNDPECRTETVYQQAASGFRPELARPHG